jgi:uncharacterized protein (DUF362 family)
MDPNQQRARVIIRHCDEYDPERIRVIVREALEELDLRPQGRTLLKPNIVMTSSSTLTPVRSSWRGCSRACRTAMPGR